MLNNFTFLAEGRHGLYERPALPVNTEQVEVPRKEIKAFDQNPKFPKILPLGELGVAAVFQETDINRGAHSTTVEAELIGKEVPLELRWFAPQGLVDGIVAALRGIKVVTVNEYEADQV